LLLCRKGLLARGVGLLLALRFLTRHDPLRLWRQLRPKRLILCAPVQGRGLASDGQGLGSLAIVLKR
jgi:hypothetical protein